MNIFTKYGIGIFTILFLLSCGDNNTGTSTVFEEDNNKDNKINDFAFAETLDCSVPEEPFVNFVQNNHIIGSQRGYELYHVKQSGSVITKFKTLNPARIEGVSSLKISPDNRYVAYLQFWSENNEGGYQIFVTCADGQSGIMRVSGNTRDKINYYKWSPDSKRILYNAPHKYTYREDTYVFSLVDYSRDLLLLTEELHDSGYVEDAIKWSPDGSRIAIAFGSGLYLYDVTLKNSKKLTNFTDNHSIETDFMWSPDGKNIAFRKIKYFSDLAHIALENNQHMLYNYNTGSDLVSFMMGSIIEGGDLYHFGWSHDSSKITYVADQDVDDIYQLMYVSPVDLQPTEVPVNVSVLPGQVWWHTNSTHIIYFAELDTVRKMFVTSLSGKTNVALGHSVTQLPANPDMMRSIEYPSGNAIQEHYITSLDGTYRALQVTVNSVGPYIPYSSEWSDNNYLAYLLRHTKSVTDNHPLHVYRSETAETIIIESGGDSVGVYSNIQKAFYWTYDRTKIIYKAYKGKAVYAQHLALANPANTSDPVTIISNIDEESGRSSGNVTLFALSH